MTLETRALGRTGEAVSILGYGAADLSGPPRGPAIDDAAAGRILNAALDGGINLIDTSIEQERGEGLIGRSISHRRVEFVLASKCGCLLELPPGTPHPRPHDYRRDNIRAGLEQSLRRMKTDYLDLLEVHASPSRAELERCGTAETLVALRDEGKVRYIGMSGTLPHVLDHIAMGVFDVFQIPYSIVQREHEDVISAAAAAGAGVLIRGGLRFPFPRQRDGAPPPVPPPIEQWTMGPYELPEGEGQRRWVSTGIDDLLDGMDRFEFMLRFTISHPDVSSTLVGTSSLDHLLADLALAAKGPLPAAVYARALGLPAA